MNNAPEIRLSYFMWDLEYDSKWFGNFMKNLQNEIARQLFGAFPDLRHSAIEFTSWGVKVQLDEADIGTCYEIRLQHQKHGKELDVVEHWEYETSNGFKPDSEVRGTGATIEEAIAIVRQEAEGMRRLNEREDNRPVWYGA